MDAGMTLRMIAGSFEALRAFRGTRWNKVAWLVVHAFIVALALWHFVVGFPFPSLHFIYELY